MERARKKRGALPIVAVKDMAKHQQEIFPKDCEKAFTMGSRFASTPL